MTHYKKGNPLTKSRKQKATEWPQKLFLIAHTRGKLVILQPVSIDRTFGRMNDSLFNAGITHFMLIDQQGNALSERLVSYPTGIRINGKFLQISDIRKKRKGFLANFSKG